LFDDEIFYGGNANEDVLTTELLEQGLAVNYPVSPKLSTKQWRLWGNANSTFINLTYFACRGSAA
jgi:hypothetical protein